MEGGVDMSIERKLEKVIGIADTITDIITIPIWVLKMLLESIF